VKTELIEEPAIEFLKFQDLENMKAVFQSRLPMLAAPGELIHKCTISYIHYKRYVKSSSRYKSLLSTCYQLDITDNSGQIVRHQTLYTKAYLAGRSQSVYAQCADPSNPDDSRIVHFPDLDMIVWLFPLDPSLPHLSEVIDLSKAVQHFPFDRFPLELKSPDQLSGITNHVIHYRPECRCTTRFDLQWQSDNQPHAMILFGKTFKECGQDIFDRMTAIWQISQRHPGSITVAQPLHYNNTIHTIWQMGVPGIALRKELRPDNYHMHLNSVAKGLATIHTSSLQSSVTHTIQDHLIEFRKKAEKLSQVYPAGAEALQALQRQLDATAASFPPTANRLIHGDFHIDQLLVDRGTIIFFDFDECAFGDPVQDVANFLVDLHFHDFPRDLLKPMAQAFIESYREYVPWTISNRWIEWHAGIQFTNKLYRSYVQQKPTFKEDFQRLFTFLSHGLVYKTADHHVKEPTRSAL